MHDARHDPHAPSIRLTPAPGSQPRDLRTIDQRECDDIAALTARLARAEEALAYLTRRVDALETDGRTYRAALDAQGDALQILTLRGTP